MKGEPLAKARQTLEAARYLFEGGFYSESVARSYYAAFYAARAALAHHGEFPRTHHGVLTAFSRRFVSSGLFAFDTGRALRNLQNKRQLADYDDGAEITGQAASVALEQATRFIEAVSSIFDLPAPNSG